MTATFGVIPKSARETVLVTRGEYLGAIFCDVRVWARDKDRLVPTKKGVTLRPEQLPDLIAGLQAARAALASD